MGGETTDGRSRATQPTLRLITRGDGPELANFLERNADAGTARYFHPFPLTAATAHSLTAYRGCDRYFVAHAAGAIVGLSMLRGWDDGFKVPSFGILVDSAWRSQGLGSRLTRFTLERARDLGATEVRLSVYRSHEAALTLYRKLGFDEISSEQVETPFGEDTVVVMLLRLGGP